MHSAKALHALPKFCLPRRQLVVVSLGAIVCSRRFQAQSFEVRSALAEFLGGARSAYEMILMAFESGDRDTLRGLLAPDVFDAFDRGISDREGKGLKVDARFIGVRDVRLERAAFDPATGEADLTLRFVGELVTAVRDTEGRVVEGDPNEVRRQTDIWTFSRKMGARDPNWLLAATGE